MLLRRVIGHFRQQEWTAIALDFLIVVLGILMAFQVTNWNEERLKRKKETRRCGTFLAPSPWCFANRLGHC